MSFSIRSLAVLLCMLALGGCKVSTTSLGHRESFQAWTKILPPSYTDLMYKKLYEKY